MPIRPQFDSDEAWLAHLRLWFAGQALAGMASEDTSATHMATSAYVIADAMLAAQQVKTYVPK